MLERFSCQLDIQEIVITQVHQVRQCLALVHRQYRTEPVEKPLYEQIVFQQAPAAAPPQLAQGSFIDQCLTHVLNTLYGSDRTQNHHFLDLADCLGGVQTLGANINAIHDGVAAEQAIGVFQIVQALTSSLVTAICNEAIGLEQASWTPAWLPQSNGTPAGITTTCPGPRLNRRPPAFTQVPRANS